MSSTLRQGSSSHFAILIFLGGNGEMCRHLSLLVPDTLTATNQNDNFIVLILVSGKMTQTKTKRTICPQRGRQNVGHVLPGANGHCVR